MFVKVIVGVGAVLLLILVVVLMLTRRIRCPNCTERHMPWYFTADFDCTLCGTPILRQREFVRRFDYGPNPAHYHQWTNTGQGG